MIITRTPFRISLFGGGTDYPQHYHQYGGAVVGFALNKYCWITLRRLPPFFHYKHRIVYSHVELVDKIQQIQHPAVRAVLSSMSVQDGLEIHHDGDLPARSGLGSSSSFIVGLIHAVHALRGRMIDKTNLAYHAIHVEQDVLQETVGSQDQCWAAFGGVNLLRFSAAGFVSVPLIVPAGRMRDLRQNLMMLFTGFQRTASEIAAQQMSNFASRRAHLFRMREMVDEAVAVLINPEATLDVIGEMLHEHWMLKRELADGVTNSNIDLIYETGRAAGALGGKLLGAGGGGFMLFYVPDEQVRNRVRDALRGLIEVDVGIDYEGSKVVLYEPVS